jgi:hypothetical protein
VGDQAETTVIPLKGFIVQHISEPPQALRDSHPIPIAHGHTKSMATGFAHLTSHSPSLSFSHRSHKFEDLLQRESQLLHKYDEQTAHPESFQRISNLSGIHTGQMAILFIQKCAIEQLLYENIEIKFLLI